MPPKRKSGKKGSNPLEMSSEKEGQIKEEQNAYIRSTLQATIVSLKQRVKALTEENEAIRRGRGKVEKDTHEFVAYFQKEMEKKDEEIAALRTKLRKLESESQTEIKRIDKEYEAKLEELRTGARDTETKLKNEIQDLQDSLSLLRDFKKDKHKVESQISELNLALHEKDRKHEDYVKQLQRQFLEEKARLMKKQKEGENDMKRQAREEAQKGLGADTRRIVIDNRRMGQELRFQQQETERLQKENTALKEMNKRLAREVQLYADKEQLWAKQGSKRMRDNKDLSSKVKSLEASITQMSREFSQERDTVERHMGEQQEEMQLEIQGLRHLIKLKNKELRTLKRLSYTILSQRSEVEQFFHDALTQVKNEIKKQKQEAASASSALTGAVLGGATRASMKSPTRVKFPAIKHVSGATAAKLQDFLNDVDKAREAGAEEPQELPEKVDFKDLSWEDRERVLRLLFAKINNVQTGGPKSSPRGGNAPGLAAMQAAEAAGLRLATPEEEGMKAAGMGAPFGLTPALPNGMHTTGAWENEGDIGGSSEEYDEPGFRPFPGGTAARPDIV